MRHNPSFGIMNHLVVKGVVVVLPAVKGGGGGDADHVVRRRVAGGKSFEVDGAKPGIFNDGSCFFERW